MIIKDNSSSIAGTNFTLTCTVENYEVNTGNLTVSMNITWFRTGIVLSSDQQRVMIFEPSASHHIFTSQLTLSPLSSDDANITCSATAYLSTHSPFIAESDTGTRSVILKIEGIVHTQNEY